jgi:hypothetical protein
MDTNSYNKEIFVKDYFNIHNHYFKIYGKSTLILMQVGSFHECYNTDNDGPDLYYLDEQMYRSLMQLKRFAMEGGNLESLELFFEVFFYVFIISYYY